MKNNLYAITKCIIALALAGAAIWLALNNGDDSETFKVMAVSWVSYFLAQRTRAESPVAPQPEAETGGA